MLHSWDRWFHLNGNAEAGFMLVTNNGIFLAKQHASLCCLLLEIKNRKPKIHGKRLPRPPCPLGFIPWSSLPLASSTHRRLSCQKSAQRRSASLDPIFTQIKNPNSYHMHT
jgi:hypothetical protein